MIRHLIVWIALTVLIAGCATQQAPVTETVKEVAKQPIVVEPQQETAPAEQQEPQKQIEPERTTVMILMKTSEGDIKLELDEEKAPKTVANFMKYVESGHYTGTIFHRVIENFMIQGGGFDADMNQKPAPEMVENEAANGLENAEGSIAMARTADPHSASAQFFINVNDNAFLNYPGQDGWGYCVFGKVVEGMDVVNVIKGVKTGNKGYHQDVPTEAVTIKEVLVVD